MPVHLTRIYTRTGDQGQTRLSDNSVANKTDPRVCAYGDVDELNSAIGLLLATHPLSDEIRAALSLVQNELFDVGADLSNPVVADPPMEPLRITAGSIERLEHWCDQFLEGLPDLRSFILPGGSPAAAQLNVCRTIARRAERSAWMAADTYGLTVDGEPEGGMNPLAIRYLNRLSDLLFILGRRANHEAGTSEVLWLPGGERNPSIRGRDTSTPE
ncbi:cob(I)yrinic acid a,c-diamide adenosyltransferase [Brooklawnia cerclae]|uniref:Corrinoid adenosyltransferase n=1 Tax=Brooklawnia cerclae TaxID=349934 RepID=A0ABX0SIH2_9ACTN|nr:cob(I)yrinic acid a,c-diamide adenosyltransferase [Brooklawnia cerclae]NIH56441.1 cob(I)alamin adenosyltransferase [Brooklawnia cerclae]